MSWSECCGCAMVFYAALLYYIILVSEKDYYFKAILCPSRGRYHYTSQDSHMSAW